MTNSKIHLVWKFIRQTAIAGIFIAAPLHLFSQSRVPNETNPQNKLMDNKVSMSIKIRMKIGSSTFTVTLDDNATVTVFKALLPMTINMKELNGNEKYFDLSGHLPTNPSNPSTIQKGDLMMYGSNTLVLFYKTFSTSYSYTKLGHLDNSEKLDSALGSGRAIVSFELQ